MMIRFKNAVIRGLMGASVLALCSAPVLAQTAQGQSVSLPVGANTEPASTVTLPATGFVISVNGNAIAGDRAVADVVRRTDVQLANADVQVTFDGLGTDPRLALTRLGTGTARAGDTVTFQSALNYPAYVTRGELQIIDRAARGGPRVLQTVEIAPNGQASVTLPQGDDLVVVHRVYDAAGRFDETAALPMGAGAQTDAEGEQGVDQAARRRIPVNGGAITVSGSDVAPGARVVALGEVVQPGSNGKFVIQRILPAGDYGVDVRVTGAGQNVDLTRDVTIPSSEWFRVGTVDLTYGQRIDGATDDTTTYTTGRVAFYTDGKLENGTRITASVDTGEGDLDQIFRRLDERDPRQLLLRVDPADLYPTYGDDSTSEDRTPTSGKIYLRIEREGNSLLWGDFKSDLGDNAFVRNDRSLYGLSVHGETRDQTSAGEARASATFYAAQPGMLPQRDTFLGTGGSVFFLEKQDIASASETIAVQLRDPDTGRVIETRTLVAGQDYAINYIQGIVTLTRPLSRSIDDGLFANAGNGRADVVLIAQYEHTPTAADVTGYAYGGRAEAWVTDTLRVGVSGMTDETGITDHRVVGADILYQMSDQTYARLDYARSEGTGFDSTFSADGGLIVDSVTASGSAGEAIKGEVRLGLADIGIAADGAIGGYFERRTEGFSNLDRSVTAATGTERFWGVFGDVAVSDSLTVQGSFDAYDNAVGDRKNTGEVSLSYAINAAVAVDLGVAHQENIGGTEPGTRTDVAAKLTYAPTDASSVYVFGQTTVRRNLLPQNDRLGLGGAYAFGNGWTVAGEVSDGSLGQAGRIAASYEDAKGNTRYLGYELDPTRELNGVSLNGRDAGRFVLGGSEQVSDTVRMFGENTYDLFGRHRSLTSAYGVDYAPTDTLNFTSSIEIGRVFDGASYDFDRKALTFGVRYQDTQTTASGRVEYRTEDGLLNGRNVTADTLLVSASAQHKFSEEGRLVFAADIARSETAQSDLVDGNYADVTLGYAFRPIDNDKLNVLARYRYLYDLYGLRDATDTDGPRQRSHVVSVDASYDLDQMWTIGGKLGYRSAQTSPDGTAAFVANDAWLAVASARYHFVHNWDALIEVRGLGLVQAGTTQVSALGAIYRHMGNNVKLGVGYNFGTFSDDLTDLTYDDKGAFINLIAKF